MPHLVVPMHDRRPWFAPLMLGAVALAGCAPTARSGAGPGATAVTAGPTGSPLVITNVTVVDVDAGSPRPGQTVVVADGRVAAVGGPRITPVVLP